MSASDACVWSEGQLCALMTEAPAIVIRMTVRFRAQWSYTNYWSWHIKAFCCLSTIQMEVVFFLSCSLLSFYTGFSVRSFVQNPSEVSAYAWALSCPRTLRPQFKTIVASMASFKSEESMFVFPVFREIK